MAARSPEPEGTTAPAAPRLIDLGYYDPTGDYNPDDREPRGLFFDENSAAKFRKVKPETHRFVIPEGEFKGHCIIVGQSGSGKSQTLLRLVEQVASAWHWKVIVIDAKADATLQSELEKIASETRLSFGAFPARPYDLWRGAPPDVATRLLDLVDLDTVQMALGHQILAKAVAGGPAKGESWTLFLNNLTAMHLNADANAVRLNLINQLKALFEGALAELFVEKKKPDGEPILPINAADPDICYLGIDALSLAFVASRLAACLLHEVADFVVKRRDERSPRILLVFDEFSAVPVVLATHLVERIRSFGVQLVLGIQSFVGLGPDAERLVEASNWTLMHRTASPEPFLKVIGTSTRRDRVGPLVDGLEVRRLQDGHMYVALRSRVAKVSVARWGT